MKAWIQVLSVFGLLAGMLATAVPVSAESGFFETWTTTPHPRQYTNAVVWVSLSADAYEVIPQVGVPVHTVWHYRTSPPTLNWQTGDDGRAAMIRNIGDATCGYTVRVDIYVGYEGSQIDSAYFTPQC